MLCGIVVMEGGSNGVDLDNPDLGGSHRPLD